MLCIQRDAKNGGLQVQLYCSEGAPTRSTAQHKNVLAGSSNSRGGIQFSPNKMTRLFLALTRQHGTVSSFRKMSGNNSRYSKCFQKHNSDNRRNKRNLVKNRFWQKNRLNAVQPVCTRQRQMLIACTSCYYAAWQKCNIRQKHAILHHRVNTRLAGYTAAALWALQQKVMLQKTTANSDRLIRAYIPGSKNSAHRTGALLQHCFLPPPPRKKRVQGSKSPFQARVLSAVSA